MQGQEPQPVALEYASGDRRRGAPWLLIWIAGTFIELAAGVILILPSLNPPHVESPRLACGSNLRQIGQAMQLWANVHQGRFPDTIDLLLRDEDLTPAVFNCPSSNDTPAAGPTTRALVANLLAGGHLSYVYLGKGLTTACTAGTVLAYEPLANHQERE